MPVEYGQGEDLSLGGLVLLTSAAGAGAAGWFLREFGGRSNEPALE